MSDWCAPGIELPSGVERKNNRMCLPSVDLYLIGEKDKRTPFTVVGTVGGRTGAGRRSISTPNGLMKMGWGWLPTGSHS